MTEVLATIVVFFAAFVQALAGIGFAMLCVPLLVLIDARLVPGPMLVAMLGLSIVMAGAGYRAVNRREFVVLIPTLLVGTLMGAPFLLAISRPLLNTVLGILVLAAVIITWSGVNARIMPRNLAIAGTFSGLMGTVAGIHGPALAVLYSSQPADKARATIAWIFIIGTIMSLTALHMTGQFEQPDMMRGLALIPGALIGFVVASAMRGRLPAGFAKLAMLTLTSASAILLLMRTWAIPG